MNEHTEMVPGVEHGFTNRIVKIFLETNLSLILILLATVVGLAALGLTPARKIRRSWCRWPMCSSAFPAARPVKWNSW